MDWTGDRSDDETVSDRPMDDDDRIERRAELAHALARGGMEDVQVLSLESAEVVFTPKRRELIETLRAEDVASVRDLARRVGRDKAQVSRDLGTLAEHGVVDYDESGRAKRPYVVQDHVVVEPI